MKNNLTSSNRYSLTICIGLAAIGISILATNIFIAPIRPGLDGSWQWAINYSFAKKLIYGIDFLFSYGPLGFVTHPLPIQNNILIAYVFQFISTYIFSLILLFYIHTNEKFDILKKISASFAVIFLIAYINNLYLSINFIFLYSTIFLLLFYDVSKKIFYIYFCSLLLGLSIFFKADTFTNVVGPATLYFAFNFRDIKGWVNAILAVCLAAFLAYGIWILIYHTPSGLSQYFKGMLEMASGYSKAMCFKPSIRLFFVFLWLVYIFIFYFFAKNRHIQLYIVLSIIPVFIIIKYTSCRNSFMYLNFFSTFHFFLILIIFVNLEWKKFLLYLPFLIIPIFIIDAGYKIDNKIPTFAFNKLNFNGLKVFDAYVLNYKNKIEHLKNSSKSQLKKIELTPESKRIIGDSTVDIYTHDLSFIPANNLNWANRPVIQTYTSYTPYLDRLDSDFYESKRAPRYLFFETQDDQIPPEIDGRYLLNSEPLTILTIFNRYSLYHKNDKNVLFLKQINQQIESNAKIILAKNIELGEWLNVPYAENGIITGRLNFSEPILGKIKNLLYKDDKYYIDYKYDDGIIKSHRLIMTTATNGIWINPYLTSLNLPNSALKTLQIRLRGGKSDFTKKKNLRIEYILHRWLDKPNFFDLYTAS